MSWQGPGAKYAGRPGRVMARRTTSDEALVHARGRSGAAGRHAPAPAARVRFRRHARADRGATRRGARARTGRRSAWPSWRATLPIAIITGRSVADVRPRLGFEPRYVIGNHGAEDPVGRGRRRPATALDALRLRIAAHARDLAARRRRGRGQAAARSPLHYRTRPRRAGGAGLHRRRCCRASSRRCARFGGKCVVNVVAAGLPDKGDALAALRAALRAPRAAVFVGDDVNDEAVFMRAEPPWLTIRIGRRRSAVGGDVLPRQRGRAGARAAAHAGAARVALNSASRRRAPPSLGAVQQHARLDPLALAQAAGVGQHPAGPAIDVRTRAPSWRRLAMRSRCSPGGMVRACWSASAHSSTW